MVFYFQSSVLSALRGRLGQEQSVAEGRRRRGNDVGAEPLLSGHQGYLLSDAAAQPGHHAHLPGIHHRHSVLRPLVYLVSALFDWSNSMTLQFLFSFVLKKIR